MPDDREQPPYDDPGTDCTDAAHPAWWRGHDHGADAMVRVLTLALHEDPIGKMRGAAQTLREAIVAMRKERDEWRRRAETLQRQWEEAGELFVKKLPHSADGVALVPGMHIWSNEFGNPLLDNGTVRWVSTDEVGMHSERSTDVVRPSVLYSTLEAALTAIRAAEAAMKEGKS